MSKRNWSCNPTCALCCCLNETSFHLFTECNYTEAAWNLTANKFHLPDYGSMISSGGPLHWADLLLQSGSRKKKRKKLGILFSLCYYLKQTGEFFSRLRYLLPSLGISFKRLFQCSYQCWLPSNLVLLGFFVWLGVCIVNFLSSVLLCSGVMLCSG
jgi:hypothetical protein